LNTQLENNETLSVLDGGELEVSSSGRIVGGTLETQGSSFVESHSGTLENVNSTGSVKVAEGEYLAIEGGFTNSGTVEVDSTRFRSQLAIGDEVSLNGIGSIVLTGSNSTIEGLDGLIGGNGVPDVLTIAPGASQLGRVQLI